MTKTEQLDILQEHSNLAFSFFEFLFSEDVDGFWALVSKVDQARVYGMYRAYIDQDYSEPLTFRDYIKNHIKPDIEQIYIPLKDNNPGIATHQRYTEDGETVVFLLPNITEPKVYETETEELVFPITMTIDASLINNEVSADWKVRIYRDQDYKVLK
ncbi:hypothetical protein ACFSO7_20760 [Bacillus sp. CGMCC 1.16607]|uniref:hypothetical protein n=1 Tax=Bacillus sp. CGMCC 1.16607 TaxID=3351842 RepID=UPI00363B978E